MCTPGRGANPRPPAPPAISLYNHEDPKIVGEDCLYNPTGQFNFESGTRWHERCHNVACYPIRRPSRRLGAGWAVKTITYFLRDELHDIDKSFRQDLTVEMLQDIAPTTRTKFMA